MRMTSKKVLHVLFPAIVAVALFALFKMLFFFGPPYEGIVVTVRYFFGAMISGTIQLFAHNFGYAAFAFSSLAALLVLWYVRPSHLVAALLIMAEFLAGPHMVPFIEDMRLGRRIMDNPAGFLLCCQPLLFTVYLWYKKPTWARAFFMLCAWIFIWLFLFGVVLMDGDINRYRSSRWM